MASMLASTQIVALPVRAAKRSQTASRAAAVAPKASMASRKVAVAKAKESAVALSSAAMTLVAGPAFAAQEVAQVAEGVNILGVVATALFILIPTSFLITLFIKSESEGNVSGGFDEDYYTESFKRGDKKAK